MLCPRCKILMRFSTQERIVENRQIEIWDIYRCPKCGFQEKKRNRSIGVFEFLENTKGLGQLDTMEHEIESRRQSETGCILCRGAPVILSIFVPKKSKVEPLRPRKTYPYLLCQKHFDSHEEPGQLDKIEEEIERRLKENKRRPT